MATLVRHTTVDATIGSITLAGTPAPGNLLVLAIASTAPSLSVPGFTAAAGPVTIAGFGTNRLAILYRVVQPGDTATVVLGYVSLENTSADLSEWSGVVAPSDAQTASGTGGSPSVSAAAGELLVSLLASVDTNTPTDGPITPSGGTTLADLGVGLASAEGIGKGTMLVGYSSSGGPYTASGTTTLGYAAGTPGDHHWAGLAAVFDGPSVDFTGTPLSGTAPLPVAFTSSAAGFTPTAWDWDFGDGSSHGTAENPTHVYAAEGVYTVSLTATDGVTSESRTRAAYVHVSGKGIVLDVYSIDPPGDSITYLATLTGAFDRFIRPERNAVGSGGFRIRRDDPDATDAVLAAGNLVKVTIPLIDPDPIFSFFIQSRDAVVVSPDETGGEVLQIAGRGALDYFDWARWLAVSYVVPWWDAGWPDLVSSAPPAGSIGHVTVAAGSYNHYTISSGGLVNYPATKTSASAFKAFYDQRRLLKLGTGWAKAGTTVTLVHLTTGPHTGWWMSPVVSGVTEVRASSVLGLRPEFGDIGRSAVTQWWDSAWGTPPGGTVGRIHVPAGTYNTYTVSGGKITAKHPGALTTAAFDAWIDVSERIPFATGTAWGTVVHVSSGAHSGLWLNGAKPLTIWHATEPDVSLLPGKVLWRICQEVQSADRPSHPMPLMTYDFTEELDSDGSQWVDTQSLAGITAEVGDSLLDSLAKVLATGAVDVEMGPDLDFHAWGERGRDLTGDFGSGVVRFEKGVNIATELRRELADGPTPTYTQVVGNDGWASAELPDASSRVARETTTRVETDDDSALAAAGLEDLVARLRRSDAAGFAVVLGNDEAAGLYYPGPPGSANGKWWLGDLVTVHTGTGPDDFDEEAMRVAALTITETESGDLVAIPETGSSLGAAEDAAFPGPSSSGGDTGGGSPSGSVITTSGSDLSAYQALDEKGVADGYAELDSSGLVPIGQMPAEVTGPDYLVGTAQSGLSAEIVVGTAPGGELGGTWSSPTVDATHSGSSHAGVLAAAIAASLGLPLGLTGATAATRYAGATASGAPVSGTFAVGDFVIDLTPAVWVCTAAGTPGTWASLSGGGGGGASVGSATPLVESGSGAAGSSANASREDHVHPAASGGGGSPASSAAALVTASTIFR